jgi:hypothetical protein
MPGPPSVEVHQTPTAHRALEALRQWRYHQGRRTEAWFSIGLEKKPRKDLGGLLEDKRPVQHECRQKEKDLTSQKSVEPTRG